jgi:hypothetical protein
MCRIRCFSFINKYRRSSVYIIALFILYRFGLKCEMDFMDKEHMTSHCN